jgi:hypothetical protein
VCCKYDGVMITNKCIFRIVISATRNFLEYCFFRVVIFVTWNFFRILYFPYHRNCDTEFHRILYFFLGATRSDTGDTLEYICRPDQVQHSYVGMLVIAWLWSMSPYQVEVLLDMCRPAVGEVQVLLRMLCMFSVFRVASSVMWKMKTLCK